jgi:MFS family permease
MVRTGEKRLPTPETFILIRDRFTWLAYCMVGFFAYFQVSLGLVMPSLRGELDLSYTVASLHYSAFALGMILAGVAGDVLARRLGRRVTFWGGGLGMALGALAFATSSQAILTILSSLAMGALGAMSYGTVNAALSDRYGEWRSVALTESQATASTFVVLTPLLVGLFQRTNLGWRSALLLASALLAVAALRYYQVPLPSSRQPADGICRSDRLPRTFWVYWAAILFVVCVEYCMVYWGASFLEDAVGLSRPHASTALSALFIGMVVGRLAGSRMNRVVGSGPVLLISFSLALVGFSLFWLAPLPWLNIAGLSLMGVGMSNMFPLILSSAVATAPDNADTATARLIMVSGLAILLAPFTLGVIADLVGIRSAYVLVVPLLALALAAILIADSRFVAKA